MEPIEPFVRPHPRIDLLAAGTAQCSSFRRNTAISDTRQMRHLSIPRGQVIDAEFVQVIVATGSGHDLHQFRCGAEKIIQLLRSFFDFQALTQMRLLCCDTDGAVIGVTGAHSQTTDGPDRRIGNNDCIRPQGHHLDKAI